MVLENLPTTVQGAQASLAHDLLGNAVLSVGRGRVRLSPGLAELVLAVLEVKKRLPAEALRALDLPERARDQADYLTTLRGWVSDAAALHEQIKGSEAELNSAVYGVYGLKNDKAVVEGFLERF